MNRSELPSNLQEIPENNIVGGLLDIQIPSLGEPKRGKVRNSWVLENGELVLVTSNRLSAYDVVVGTVPKKGMILNMTSQHWFNRTGNRVPNHMLAVPHPNVMIAKQAQATLPAEVVLRAFVAESGTSTSISKNYFKGNLRNIYGIDFPDGLQQNQPFPKNLGRNGVIITPTTKAEEGKHDEMLTQNTARELVDGKLGEGIWDQAAEYAYMLFEQGSQESEQSNLLLVDTKYEFGVDENGNVFVIDELHTPDSSRYWRADTYAAQLAAGEKPQNFDKEGARKYLSEKKGYTGQPGVPIPEIEPSILYGVSSSYEIPWNDLTHGMPLPNEYTDPSGIVWDVADPKGIESAVLHWQQDQVIGSWQ